MTPNIRSFTAIRGRLSCSAQKRWSKKSNFASRVIEPTITTSSSESTSMTAVIWAGAKWSISSSPATISCRAQTSFPRRQNYFTKEKKVKIFTLSLDWPIRRKGGYSCWLNWGLEFSPFWNTHLLRIIFGRGKTSALRNNKFAELFERYTSTTRNWQSRIWKWEVSNWGSTILRFVI